MSQSTLDRWFTITKSSNPKNLSIKVPKYFYLDWYNKDSCNYRNAIFCDSIPDTNNNFHRFTTSINWKVPTEHRNRKTLELGLKYIKNKLIICGDFRLNHPEYPLDQDSDYGEAVPLLKSNLQKCVRRMLTGKAIRTSHELMKLDLQQFLRRLPIIILEDTRLCTGFSTVIWMMAANGNGWIPSKVNIEWLLGLVHQITMSPHHDLCDYKRITNPHSMWKGLGNNISSTYVYAMYLRMVYGGMRNDRKMLASLMDIWYERFTANQCIVSLETIFVNLDDLSPFTKDDVIPEAVDFHCYPWIIYRLCGLVGDDERSEGELKQSEGDDDNSEGELKQSEGDDKQSEGELKQEQLEENIRKTIWHCRSGINKRNNNATRPHEYQETYSKIKKTLWDLSNYIIYKL